MSELSAPRFCDLGAIEIERDGATESPGGAILGRLLSRLLIDAGHRVDVHELVDAVWGDRATARSVSTLESHLHRLRRFLEPGRGRGEASALLRAESGGYRLDVGGDRIDSVSFAGLVRASCEALAAGDAGQATERAEQARALWRGRPYAPWSDEPWATATVAKLEELHRQLTDTLVGALLADAHPERALVELEPVLAAGPLRERPWEHYLLAAARTGRTEDALAGYRRADRLFRDELGVEPGPELRRLHQLVLSGTAGTTTTHAVAPPQPAATPEVHLPRRRSRLIGRDAELAGLTARLTAGSTVTIVGGAGCGKTSLAVTTAQRIAADFPDGVWFVDLTSALDADQVGTAAATSLGLAGAGGSSIDALQTFTRTRRMLIVLDNCEHVLDPAAELVEKLRTSGSALTVLATSREPLEVEGEQLVELGPLPVGESHASPAVELFLERFTDAGPDRRLDAENLALASEICASVDGVPLAIELAAARGRAFSLPEIAEQVRVDPSALSRVGRGRDGRQTVRTAVERSVRLLSSDEQCLHAAMSAVSGPMTVGLAAALIEERPAEADDLVAGLVHRSLLVADGALRPGRPSRFAQLAIVGGHGAHTLDDAAKARIADRRDAYVVDAVVARPRTGMPGDAGLQDAMDDDLPAVRATLHRALIDRPSWGGPAIAAGLGMYWYYRGMLLEGGRWIGLAVRHRALARPVDDAILASSVAALHLLGGDPDAAGPHIDALCAAADQASGDDLLLIGDEFGGLSSPAFHTGDQEVLQLLADRAADVAYRTGDEFSALMARAARLKARPLDPDDQRSEAAAVRSAAQQLGSHYIGWMAATDAVRACLALDDVEGALGWSERGVEDTLALGAREAPPLMELHGTLHARRGDDEAAVRFLSGARTQNRRAAMHWPTRPETPAVLEEAARRLGAATFERAWREGDGLRLADVVARTGTAVPAPRSDRSTVRS